MNKIFDLYALQNEDNNNSAPSHLSRKDTPATWSQGITPNTKGWSQVDFSLWCQISVVV